jgi:predicted Fe-Mo cluster-binding NifX family protein
MKWVKLLGSWLVATWLTMAVATAWADDTRVAVAAEAAHVDAPISSVAARAPHILIFDANRASADSHPNPVAVRRGGAGPALAHWLAEQRVGTLIAGKFGAKLAQALKERNIRTVVASGPASRAVKEFRE